ncbi:uncharacterized protein DS421_9g280410 [Arachis hypogaea]|nr:uncharacterized protein DS421_9g280410 [Arachis hypogaea]
MNKLLQSEMDNNDEDERNFIKIKIKDSHNCSGSFGEERSPRKRWRKEAVELCLRLMCMASSHYFSVSLTLSLSRRHSSPHYLCARREACLCPRRRRPPLCRRQNASIFEPSLYLYAKCERTRAALDSSPSP